MAKKEVYYVEYCQKCVHWEKQMDDEPCNECLTQCVNEDSHKPVYFEDKEKK